MAKRKLTILHSNDLHGDFLPKTVDGVETGGLSRLSGYVKKVRAEEEYVIYANAGDMFRGSVIDSEYLGLSTIDMMNLLAPDVMTIGNHEVDYGIAHLLFLEKCARFPVINANQGDFPFTGFFAAKKEQLRVSNRKFSRFQQIALCRGEKGRMGKAAVPVTPGRKVRYSFDQFILFHTAVS